MYTLQQLLEELQNCRKGGEGQEIKIKLELKLIADVALGRLPICRKV